ncbi:hypothetical protein GGX14DRAFT_596757 [Mycena pura]|uniref:Uncharacterized protein n=1 Tax=Mycena pura TaxID=153505 RepID=A0AAD6UP96_9AGAR|nr:hypothetical protein GGX14DRAFT_596757 [Mycena pura]
MSVLSCDLSSFWILTLPASVALSRQGSPGQALSGGMYPVSGVFADRDVMLCIKPGEAQEHVCRGRRIGSLGGVSATVVPLADDTFRRIGAATERLELRAGGLLDGVGKFPSSCSPAPSTEPSAWASVAADERMNIDVLVTPDVAPTRAPMQLDAPARLVSEPLPMTLLPASPGHAIVEPTATPAMIGAAALSSLSLQLMGPAWRSCNALTFVLLLSPRGDRKMFGLRSMTQEPLASLDADSAIVGVF